MSNSLGTQDTESKLDRFFGNPEITMMPFSTPFLIAMTHQTCQCFVDIEVEQIGEDSALKYLLSPVPVRQASINLTTS